MFELRQPPRRKPLFCKSTFQGPSVSILAKFISQYLFVPAFLGRKVGDFNIVI